MINFSVNPERTLERAIAVQQIAAPTFEERRRAEYVAQEFKKLGLSDVEMDGIGNVFARRRGANRSRPILVTAHTDTVFPAQTDLTVTRTHERICGPGIGDNSLAVAALFELVQILDEAKIETDGDLWLAANVCEEGLGDLRGMRKVVERFGDSVKATIIIEGMSFGRVIHGAIGVHRFRITAQADGGHSWSKFGNPSAIHGLIKLANHIVEMDVPKRPKTTYNIGVIRGGTSVNTIANEASLELDMRSESVEALNKLVERVESLIKIHNSSEVRLTYETISQRPAGMIPLEHPLIQLAADSLRAVGSEPQSEVGSTDANIPLSKGLPAVVVGICEGHNAHHPDEYIETARTADGMKQLVMLVTGAFGL
jgi:acetylornithine deacetylase/succinyl-diaminopimelate desuccinylase-like protein